MKFKQIALVSFVSSMAPLAAIAQPGDVVLPPLTGERPVPPKQAGIVRSIMIKNVRPGIMAWWLDPENQPTPFEHRDKSPGVVSRSTNPYVATAPPTVPQRPPGMLSLMSGVDSIVAIDSQNVILAYGTAEGVQQLETVVGFLDKARPKVLLETYVVEGTPTELRALGIKWMTPQPATIPADAAATTKIGTVRGNLPANLTALVKARRASVLFSPRGTTLSGLTASFAFDGGTISGPKKEEAQATAPMSLDLRITPTLKSDDSVELAINLVRLGPLPASGDAKPFATKLNTPSTEFVAIGLNVVVPDGLIRPFSKGVAAGKNVVLFIKAQREPAPQ